MPLRPLILACCLSLLTTGAFIAVTSTGHAQQTTRTTRTNRPAKLEPLKPGLLATYSAGGHSVSIIVPRPLFALDAAESLHPQIPPQFTAVYEGVLRIDYPGQFTLGSVGDAVDAKILLNGQPAMDQAVALTKGDHALRVELTRAGDGPARFQLHWKSDQFPLEPIPAGVLGQADLPPSAAAHAAIERGRLLVEEHNCIGCHKADSPSLVGRSGPDLTDIGSRVTPAWINKWLENPKHFRAAAVMPRLLSKEENRRNVTAFLATLKGPPQPPLNAQVNQQLIDDAKFIYQDIGCADCHSEDAKGVSLAGVGSKYASAEHLTRYLLDPLAIDPSGRMPSMLLSEPEAAALSAHLMQSKNAEYEGEFPGGNAMVGQQLVRVIGCLNCHEIRTGPDQTLQPLMVMAVPPLNQVDPARGCLSDAPRAPMPIYTFTADEQHAIRLFIDSFKTHPDVSPAPNYEFYRTATRFNCITCHNVRDTVALERKELIPPLANSGLKLRPDFIGKVLMQKVRVRPWTDRRMPHFGAVLKDVPHQIVAAGGMPPLPPINPPDPQLVKAGQVLAGIGATGFGCVGCHEYKESMVTVPPESRGPEFTTMADRIRPDWFHRWVRDPQRIQPNTAMPNFFSGKPEADVQRELDALWNYISLGQKMPAPEGLAD